MRFLLLLIILIPIPILASGDIYAQDSPPTADNVTEKTPEKDGELQRHANNVAATVQVDPVNSDDRIQRRLNEILEATG